MDQIDLTGPFAALSRLPNATVKLVWKTTDPIRDYRGLGLIPDAKLADTGEFDLFVVPGGLGQEALMEDEAVLSFIAKRAETAACVFSVCAGAPVCGAAGAAQGEEGDHALGVGAVPQVLRRDFRGRAGGGRREAREHGRADRRHRRGAAGGGAPPRRCGGEGDPARHPVHTGAAVRLRAPGQGPKENVARQRAAFRPLTEKRAATAKKVAARLGVRVEE